MDSGNTPATPSSDGLTPRQRRFALEYLKNPNATQAAVAAGYSEKTARTQGPRLLRNVAIASFLKQRATRVERKLELDAEYVLRSLKGVAERCQQAVPVMVREGRKLVQKTEEDPETGEERGVWQFDSSGANKALELLGKHLKLFSDKVKLSGKDGGPLVVEIRDLAKEPTEET